MGMKKELLDILCCPKCKGDLNLNATEDQLVCLTCRKGYPIRNDIPILLVDEALPLPKEQPFDPENLKNLYSIQDGDKLLAPRQEKSKII